MAHAKAQRREEDWVEKSLTIIILFFALRALA